MLCMYLAHHQLETVKVIVNHYRYFVRQLCLQTFAILQQREQLSATLSNLSTSMQMWLRAGT